MNDQLLQTLARSTAARYGLTLEPNAIGVLTQKLPHINSRHFAHAMIEHDALEAAFRVVFIEAEHRGYTRLTATDLTTLLNFLCPLPPIC